MEIPFAGQFKLRFIGNSNNFDARLTVGSTNRYTNDNGADGSIEFVADFVNIRPGLIQIQAATFEIDKVTSTGSIHNEMSECKASLIGSRSSISHSWRWPRPCLSVRLQTAQT